MILQVRLSPHREYWRHNSYRICCRCDLSNAIQLLSDPTPAKASHVGRNRIMQSPHDSGRCAIFNFSTLLREATPLEAPHLGNLEPNRKCRSVQLIFVRILLPDRTS